MMNKTFLVLSQGRVHIFLVVPQVLILVPREGKHLFCPSDLEFLSLTSKNLEFLSLTQTSFFVRDKNSRFFDVRDKNSRSSGQNKFLLSLRTKIKTFGTTRNICTLPLDHQKILILSDNKILKESRPKKNAKTSFCFGRKKSLSKNDRPVFFLIILFFFGRERVFYQNHYNNWIMLCTAGCWKKSLFPKNFSPENSHSKILVNWLLKGIFGRTKLTKT